MQNRSARGGLTMLALAVSLTAAFPWTVRAARESKAASDSGASVADLEPRRLYDKAQELFQGRENERAVRMLESVIEQYPASPVVHMANLALGKYYLQAHEQISAVNYFGRLRKLEQPDRELTGSERDLWLEAMYLTGVAYFQIRQYGVAFPVLRKITNLYPNTVWANQSYYYIGMCHFAQQNWNKAIEALSLVGTFVDPDSPTVQYVEAGRRFYIKIQDADLPILLGLGKTIIAAETSRGDGEALECIPLTAEGDVVIGSIPTEIGLAKSGDHVLQVLGGDTIVTRYVDENVEDGAPNTVRTNSVKVVSTAGLSFTMGNYEGQVAAAFLGQPLFILVQDEDKDVSDAADAVDVVVISRYKEPESQEEGATPTLESIKEGDGVYRTRDRVALRLTEIGPAAPIRTGRFGAKLTIQPPQGDEPVNQGDQVLTCNLNDEIVATYTDELHIGGDTPRTVETRIPVVGEIDSRPRATQDVVYDPVIRAKKEIVEATAYLELARIFKSMGLLKGAQEKAAEGLDRADVVIRMQSSIPSELRQEAFKLKWDLHIICDNFASAIATCQLFNRLYPDSMFADQALMGIGRIHMEGKRYHDAVNVFRQVLALPWSNAKAEAQFRIAEATEATASKGSAQPIQEYKLCAERYPDSPFAGEALSKLVDYHVESRDYAQAGVLLEQIFQDYPDAAFLDSMLLKWVLVAYRSGDYPKARDKCTQLLFEYPESPYAQKAKQILPRIEGQLKKGGETTTTEDTEKGTSP